ncbi:hypothetical protein Q8G35_18560 [Peribacillus simplex]|uniref:Uncharacterized protein n=2 Tax=Peribacillus TaxID=2675229 RepID=A0AA90PF37_9BACI|nr:MULTISPECIES: hypothetical protein [Peribacillus]MDP1420330.1 hypothetical protein [Peribacillus simplex]MDP1453411.1 hypothetical protein [Peribacillus frigoritolerans]
MQQQTALEQISAIMQIIADQKEEITELRKLVVELEKKQEEQEEYIKAQLTATQQKSGGNFGNKKKSSSYATPKSHLFI